MVLVGAEGRNVVTLAAVELMGKFPASLLTACSVVAVVIGVVTGRGVVNPVVVGVASSLSPLLASCSELFHQSCNALELPDAARAEELPGLPTSRESLAEIETTGSDAAGTVLTEVAMAPAPAAAGVEAVVTIVSSSFEGIFRSPVALPLLVLTGATPV